MLHKKIYILASVASLFFLINFFSPFSINATETADPGLEFDPTINDVKVLQNKSKLGDNDPATIAYGIINWALIFLGIITLVMIIIAGFMWMFAAGEEEKIKKAQDILKGALVGLVLILASYGIASYVFSKLVSAVGRGPTIIEQTPVEDFEIDPNYTESVPF